ncbi:MAG: 3'-5' exonuclease [Candidatus Doudnabacteria bacterium]|nr:3'-5' exonuclease [Candidatus Doudnabacteria bacterium]
MWHKNYTIVDVETTGGSPLLSRVIEIGLIRVEKGEVVERFKSLINPQIEIPQFITEMTGIKNSMVKKAPTFEELSENLLPLFEDSVFVAHNSNFDYSFLKAEFAKAGLVFSSETLCTVRLSRILFPQYKRHNLSTLIERFGFKCKNRHRAYDDAKVLLDFLKHVDRTLEPKVILRAIDSAIKKISPARFRTKLQKDELRELEYISEI